MNELNFVSIVLYVVLGFFSILLIVMSTVIRNRNLHRIHNSDIKPVYRKNETDDGRYDDNKYDVSYTHLQKNAFRFYRGSFRLSNGQFMGDKAYKKLEDEVLKTKL